MKQKLFKRIGALVLEKNALIAIAASAMIAEPMFGAIAGAGGIALVRTIGEWQGVIEAVAYPVTVVGSTLAGIALYKAHGDFKQIGHGGLEIASLGAIVLGIPGILGLIPGVQGALI